MIKRLLIIILVLAITWGLGFVIGIKSQEDLVIPDYGEEIEALNAKIDSLEYVRDSLLNHVSESKDSIIQINHWYEKTRVNITNGTVTDDMDFFTNYISESGISRE